MSAQQAPILETKNLVKVFGGVRAIDGLDFSVRPGELRCILGPNGAGKSTLFKLLMGVERPSEGQVFYRGRDVTRLGTHERARLGLTCKFQNVPIYQELTVAQNLFVPLRRHHGVHEIPGETAKLLARLHLSGTEGLMANTLSHGQQQWLSIGMSLAAQPQILLLDEPTAGMGPEETRETGEIVLELNRQGVTIVVIEHDMAIVRQLAPSVTVLHFGRLFAQGSMAQIENDPSVQDIYLGTGARQ